MDNFKMKIKDRFNLSHVVGFFVGIVVTIIFNWIVFKDPKRITAPGVAALVAMCTFTLALWSALQVKEWLATKKKEAGFNHTIKILEIIEKSHEDIDPLYQQCNNIKITTKQFGEITLSEGQVKNLKDNINKVELFCNRLAMSLGMLKYWNIEIRPDNLQRIRAFIEHLRNANIILDGIISFQKNVDKKIQEVDEIHKNAFQNANAFLQYSYDDIFIPLTSPSKKVDK